MSPEEHLLFLTVGMAIAKAQHFENLVATILFSLSPKAAGVTLENYDELIQDLDKKTLGQLKNLMKEKVTADELHAKLVSVVEGRNFIAHHSLKNYSDLTEDEAINLMKKIEGIVEEIDEVQNLLIESLSQQNVTHISEIVIDNETGEIRDVG